MEPYIRKDFCIMKKCLSLLLTALMLIPALTACSGNTPDTPATENTSAPVSDTSASIETEPAVTGRADAKDDLPANLDLGGRTVGIHTRDAASIRPYDVDGGGEENGDIIFDAVYKRNRSVEERLKVKLEVTADPAAWKQVGNTMEQNILAGDDTWDLYFAQGMATLQASRDHLFMDLANSKYIDYTQPWWWTDSMEEISLDGKSIRYLIGDICLNNYTRAGSVLFNKKLYQDVLGDPENLYQLVIDGGWTYDKLMEYCSKLYADLNGDGQKDINDRFGLIVEYKAWLTYMEYSGDFTRFVRNADGLPEMKYDLDRAQVHLEKINKLLYETNGVTYLGGLSDKRYFVTNHTVFYAGQLNDLLTADIRNMEAEYGVIPYPKTDDKQENYTGIVYASGNMVSIPVICKTPDEIGAICEALCAESYRSVIEPFYDTAMKAKYVQDSKSGQCIDIITDTAHFDFAYYFSGVLGGGNILQSLAQENSSGLSSAYASKVNTVNKNILALAEKYEKLRSELKG